jgi:hypothetical protein
MREGSNGGMEAGESKNRAVRVSTEDRSNRQDWGGLAGQSVRRALALFAR